jgi:hypothetical protein
MLSVDKQYLRNNMPKMNHKKRGRPIMPFKKIEGYVVSNPAFQANDVNLMT